jgi:hypothetical protein
VKNIIPTLLAMIVGAAVLAYGVYVSGNDLVCGGQVMKPGDTCVSSDGHSWDYDALRARNQDKALLYMVGGGAFLVLGGAALVVQLRRRNRRAAQPPAAV